MCLSIYGNVKIKKTRKERVFYKVLRKENHGNDFFSTKRKPKDFFSPYMNTQVKLGVLQTVNEQDDFDIDEWEGFFERGANVYGGGFHLFKKERDAQMLADCMNKSSRLDGQADSCKHVVVKAIVPEGTKYVEGYHCGTRCVVAKSVIYEKL